MPAIRQNGVDKRTLPGMQGDHALPRQDPTTLTNIPAADEHAAAEKIAQLEAQLPATQPGPGTCP